MVLLAGTGLLVHSFAMLVQVNPGFDPADVLTADISLPAAEYATAKSQIAFFDLLMLRLSAVPGVRAVAMSAALPLTHIRITPILAEGQPVLPLAERPFTVVEAISPRFFETMRIPITMGRVFTEADTNQSARVVIVNTALARRYWPSQNPLGRHITVGRQMESEVVGVAGNATNNGLTLDPEPQIYLPFPQLPWGNMNVLLRTAVDPRSVYSAVRKQVSALDPTLPVTKLQTVAEIMDDARAQPRFTMFLLSVFSVVAIVLTMVGVHGVLAFSVAQRRMELGIRLALGGSKSQIVRMLVGQGLALTATGIALGWAGSFALARAMSTVLYKTSPHDPVTFVTVPILFLIVCLVAIFLPARRAAQIDPSEVLRQT
jgi:predicted permease